MDMDSQDSHRSHTQQVEEEKGGVILPSDIQADYTEKKTSKVAPEPESSRVRNSSPKKKAQASATDSATLNFYREKGPEIKTTSDVILLGNMK